jgi:ATP-dependent helicase YprA (DUF1998 family)
MSHSKEEKAKFVNKNHMEFLSFGKENKELFFSANASESILQQMNHALLSRIVSPPCKCGDPECTYYSIVGNFEATVLFWWIHKHGELLKEMIENHQKGYEKDADRATDELFRQLGKREDDKGDQ